jgi:CDP-paratose 2-epimerase
MYEFWKAPRVAEVYNPGGGKGNTCWILEALQLAGEIAGQKMKYQYLDTNCIGDHICYYSDPRKVKAHYPAWDIAKPLPIIFAEIARSWVKHPGYAAQ